VSWQVLVKTLQYRQDGNSIFLTGPLAQLGERSERQDREAMRLQEHCVSWQVLVKTLQYRQDGNSIFLTGPLAQLVEQLTLNQ
jgi:hypothetical protein